MQQIFDVLDSCGADYVKWDMNRSVANVYSSALPPERQGEVFHRYVLGVYEMMEQLVSRYPDLLFENCCGGGGRFDAGMLYYSPQIWCSDNTDAIERISIQYGTSFGYPVSSMGAHVSVSPNLQTGRVTPLTTRGIVAMAGVLGYELDVCKLSAEERELVKEQIRRYQKYQELILYGDYYRLTEAEKNQELAAWQFVSRDQRQALVSAVCLRARSNPLFGRVRLKGLKEDAWYRVRCERLTDEVSKRDAANEGYEPADSVYSGSALMYAGMNLPVFDKDYESVRYVVESICSGGAVISSR